MTKSEHLPVNSYLAAVEEVGDLLRTPHAQPERTGPPTDMSDLELGLAANYADDPNSRKPHVAARVARQQDQADALETYRPNFIASVESDRDEVFNQIDERRGEIKRNTPLHRRIGKKILNAVSYVPGLDLAVANHRLTIESNLHHVGRNLQYWQENPSQTKLHKANKVYDQKYGGKGSYADEYNKSLRKNRRHESDKYVFDLEQEILLLQKDVKKMQKDIRELHNGRSL